MDAVITVPAPVNEAVKTYAPGSAERASLESTLDELSNADPIELTATIDGVTKPASGDAFEVTMPSDHAHVLGHAANATRPMRRSDRCCAGRGAGVGRAELRATGGGLPTRRRPARRAVAGHGERRHDARPGQDRPAGRDRRRLRADRLLAVQRRPSRGRSWPTSRVSSPGVWNRTDYRPLEGFVYAITPFNFTAIAGNLPTAPALMGNMVIWKPSPTQQYAAHFIMRLLEAAGLPPGVINMLPGDGMARLEVALRHRRSRRHPLHRIDRRPSSSCGRASAPTSAATAAYPRLVGETGGKDFVVAHASADPDVRATALVRGAFEYSGQKCSAALAAYIARSVWDDAR